MDILKSVDTTIYAGSNLGKILPFEAIFTIKIRAIVYTISAIMALIEYQIDNLPILFLSHLVSDNVLFLYNTKKNQHYYINFQKYY